MKLISFLTILAAGVAGLYLTKAPSQAINPILGDESYEVIFGKEVPSNISEQERIRIHLAYVEHLLKKKDVHHLSAQLREKRKQVLNLLHNYWTKGEFPANYDYPNERKPCFRDKSDQICAVGFLVQQTGNEKLVKSIERSENYATIYEMTNPHLLAWVSQSGLTLEECAMIQPTYGTPPSTPPNYIPAGYAISSSTLSGVSLSTSLISASNLNSTQKNGWVAPSIGLASGISQITLGAVNYNRYFYYNSWETHENARNKNLSMFNIGFGTFTTIFNSYALIRHIRGKKSRSDLSWNIYGYQSPAKEFTLGFHLVKQF